MQRILFLASAWKNPEFIENFEGLSLVDTSFAPTVETARGR